MRRIALFLVLPVCLFALTACEDDFKTMCEDDLGGVVKTSSKTVVSSGVSSDGKPVILTTVITTRFCVKDGEILATE